MVQRASSSSSQHGRFGRLWTMKLGNPFPSFTKKSILIAVMGMTGVGKTYFIKHVTGLDEMEVGHGLASCTKEIQVATTQIDGYEVHLIDTPGFNDDNMNDSDILLEIAAYLKTGVQLSGILYLHPITDSRIGGTGIRNLELLQNLVGQENMGNVKLITTKWSRTTPEESGPRLNDLVTKFWKEMITAGAQLDQYDGTVEDAKRIVLSVLKTSPVTLLFQQELQEGREVEKTSAGKSLMEAFVKLQEKYDRDMKELKAVNEKFEEALRKRDEALEQLRKLHEAKIKDLEGQIKNKRGTCVIL